MTHCVTPMDTPRLALDLLPPVELGSNDDWLAVKPAADELERAFEHAGALYEARDYAAAAGEFMTAARAARAHDLLAPARASCYRNAAKAWEMAGVLREKRPLLEEVAREDPLCAGEIGHILELLDPDPPPHP